MRVQLATMTPLRYRWPPLVTIQEDPGWRPGLPIAANDIQSSGTLQSAPCLRSWNRHILEYHFLSDPALKLVFSESFASQHQTKLNGKRMQLKPSATILQVDQAIHDEMLMLSKTVVSRSIIQFKCP